MTLDKYERMKALLREILDFSPHTYRCMPLNPEMTHFEPEDWQDIKDKIKIALEGA